MTASSDESAPRKGWPKPIPLRPPAPDPLPLDPFPGWLRRHIESVAGATQTPSDLAVMQGLAALSTALANKATVQVRGSYSEPVHVWSSVVLPPASRKSAVHKHMTRPVSAFEADRARDTREDRQMLAHRREALEERLKSAKNGLAEANGAKEEGEAREQVRSLQGQLNELEDPSPPRLLASDVTAEKLTQLMAQHHGRIAVLAPEGEIFRLMAGRYRSKGTNFDPHKRAWTGDEPIRDDRMGREGSHVRRPALTLGICVQPSLFETLNHQESFRGEGLLARFLYAVPESGIGSRLTGADVPDLDEEDARVYANRLRTLLDLDPAEIDDGEYVSHGLHLTAEARDLLYAFEAEVESMLGPGGRLSDFRDWGGKLVGQAVRLSGLLHAAKHVSSGSRLWDRPMGSSTMAGAVALARALIPHARVFFDALERDEGLARARYVWQRIRSGDQATDLTVSKVHRRCQGKAEIESVEDVEQALEVLQAHHLIRVEPRLSAGGRPPSPWVHVHPSLSNGADPGQTIERSDRSSGFESESSPSVTSVNPSRQEETLRAHDSSSREEG